MFPDGAGPMTAERTGRVESWCLPVRLAAPRVPAGRRRHSLGTMAPDSAAEAKHRASPRGLQSDWLVRLVPEQKTPIRTRDRFRAEAVLRNLREPYSSDFLPLARCGAVVTIKIRATSEAPFISMEWEQFPKTAARRSLDSSPG